MDGGAGAGAGGYDAARTLRIGLFGLALYGPLSGAWYGALDHWVLPANPAGAAAAGTTKHRPPRHATHFPTSLPFIN